MKRKRILFTAACSLAMLVSACSSAASAQEETESTAAKSQAAAVQDEEQTETVQTADETDEADPEGTVQEEEVEAFSVDWEYWKGVNPDIVAWIYIPQCNISYPVLQGPDNDYYLRQTEYLEYDVMGCIFMHYASNADFTSDNTIIYGHSDYGGDKFTTLDMYEDESFFEENPCYYILSEDQNYRADIRIFARVQETSALYTLSFGDYREEVLSSMMADALYSRDVQTDGYNFVTLSTCDLDYGYHSLQRLCLNAVLVPTDEVIEKKM